MTPQSKSTVDFNFYNIEEDQFLRILARLRTSIVKICSKQHFAIQDVYIHVKFMDDDITNLHVEYLILIC